MKIQALVAITDGTPGEDGRALMPGCINAKRNIPVSLDFNPARRVGWANLRVKGDRVIAELDVDPTHVDGLTPAIGFRGIVTLQGEPVTQFTDVDVIEIGLSKTGNADDRIPALDLRHAT